MRALRDWAFRDWTTSNVVALLALAAAVAGVGVQLARAWPVDPAPRVTARALAPLPRLAEGSARDGARELAVAVATELDPFHSVRVRRDGTSFDTANTELDLSPAIPSSAPPPPGIVLQGVAIMPGGAAVAVLSVQGRPAHLVRVGDLVTGGLRLARVERGAATLAGADTTMVLRLPNPSRPAPRPAAPPAVAARGVREAAQ